MSDPNPFAPPEASTLQVTQGPEQGSFGEFSIGQCIQEGWEGTWANFPTWLGVYFVGFVLAMLSLVTVIGIIALLPVFLWGLTQYHLNMHDRKGDFSDLFSGFHLYGTALVGMLVTALLLALVGIPAQIVQWTGMAIDSDSVAIIGQILGFLIGIGISPRLSFAYMFVVDRDMTPVDAIKASWEATDGQWLKIIVLTLLSIPIGIAGVMALGIGILPAMVMISLMLVSAYRQMVGDSDKSEEAWPPSKAPA